MFTSSKSIKRLCQVLLFMASIAVTGCGEPSATPSDPAKAVVALKSVLDSWKAGETPETLSGRSPSIHVVDLDWEQGYKLVDYKAADDGYLAGYDMNYKVALQLKSPKGKLIKRNAIYTVSTHPEVMIQRQEG